MRSLLSCVFTILAVSPVCGTIDVSSLSVDSARLLLLTIEGRQGTRAQLTTSPATCVSEVQVPSEHEHALESGALFLELASSLGRSPVAGVAQAAAGERGADVDLNMVPGAPRLQQLRSSTAASGSGKGRDDPATGYVAPSPSATASPLPPSGLPSDLDCRCQPSSCKCDKQCFCRVRTDAFDGNRLEPPSGLSALADMPPDHDCACSMGDVGGPGLDSLNTVDCDCLVAACACARKCTCSQKAVEASPSSQPASGGSTAAAEEGK